MSRHGNEQHSGPRKVRGGIKARSARGEFSGNWWARRWLKAMENLVDVARLQRGKRYASMGQVLSMEEKSGNVVAKVQGTRSKPYKVKLGMAPLTDKQWEKVLDKLTERAIFVAQLLAGEMPVEIEEVFAAAGVSLFPVRTGDLITQCSCPDWANPCKHVAAAHYVLGDRFDEDPFLLFRLRGRTQEQILAELRRRRADSSEEIEKFSDADEEDYEEEDDFNANLNADDRDELYHFWNMPEPLDDFSITVKSPDIRLPIFRRLGEPNIVANDPLESLLSDVYNIVSQAALVFAYVGGDNGSSESDDD